MPAFIEVACPCGRKVRALPAQGGTAVRCWNCGSDVHVPMPKTAGKLLGAFGNALRDTLRVDSLSVLVASALGLSAILMIPYVGNYLGFAALVVGARLYQNMIRDVAPPPRGTVGADQDETDEEPEPWLSWSLAVLSAVCLVAPFVLRSPFLRVPMAVRWAMMDAAYAAWLVVPLALLAFTGRDRRGPLPPPLVLKALTRHPVATAGAALVLPLGLVLVEFLTAALAYGENQLPILVDDLFTTPALNFEGVIVNSYHFDNLRYDVPLGQTPEYILPLYSRAIRRGYTLCGTVPASLSRGTQGSVDMREFNTLDVLYLGNRATLTVLILVGAGVVLSLQARMLGLITLHGSWRAVPAPDVAAADAGAPASLADLDAARPLPAAAASSATTPALAAPGGHAAAVLPAPLVSAHAAAAGGLPTLLVVDADRGFAVGLGRALSGRGFAVLLAGTAAEASALVRGARPDLVVFDTALPDRSGFELCHELRELGPPPSRPILIATSQTATADEVASMARSADDYLIKPYVLDALVARINLHLQKGD